MKPIAANEHEQGFLEYLEDIIGTERFKKPLELLNLKVEELSAMWAEKVENIFIKIYSLIKILYFIEKSC
jgi:structural maintenance of chromosome 4